MTVHENSLEWRISDSLVSYPDALETMERRVTAIRADDAGELVWLLEHPPLYTAGTSARPSDLKDPNRFPVYDAGRGGQYTYHGPGQRVGYFMLDLRRRGKDVRCFVHHLEEVMIKTVAAFGVTAERRAGRVGVWVTRPGGVEEKIGAIGVRVRKWVTFHGLALNVDPDLSHFGGIVPCGIADHGVTSLAALGLPVTMDDVDVVLRQTFDDIFGIEARPMPEVCAQDAAPDRSPETTHPVFQI